MNGDRIEVLSVWQEAARLERDALRSAREKIVGLIAECETEEYPRMEALDADIAKIERSITQREIRIDKLLKSEANAGTEPTRLSLLLSWQDDAREDREALIAARDALPDDCDDERFAALTHEIADIDEEIVVRGEEIETLAALAGV